jgi:hypothetical protein
MSRTRRCFDLPNCHRAPRHGRRTVSPRQAGLIGAVVVAPILAMVWYGTALILAFYAGATFGGYGEAARGPTAKWYVPVVASMGVLGIIADLFIGRAMRRVVARRQPRGQRQ